MPAPPPQSGQNDNSMGFIWIVAAIFAAGGVLWFAFKKAIIGAYFKVKLFEISLVSYFTNNLDDVRTVIQTTPADQFSFKDVVIVGQAVGSYLRIPFVIIIFLLAILVYLSNSARTFKRIYTMRDLAQAEQINWPQITPVVNLDLLNTDIDKGPWAMALTPIQFCKKYGLLDEHKRQAQEGLSRKERSQIEVSLKRGQANKIFSIQLGPLWQGVEKLAPHIRSLFIAFLAKFEGDSDATVKLLANISASSTTKLDFSGADELWKKHQGSKLIKKMDESHAYVLTVMASMLEMAREDGVQASADFLWLKPVDRRLWYMLNTVGRQTPFVEVAGPYAHWIAEKEADRKLIVPLVDEATNALEIALKEIIYRPDEQQ